MAQISPMLAVSDPTAAIAFYKRAFGATELWRIGDPVEVAGLVIEGAELFLAREQENPRSPDSAGFTTVRIELFAEDPAAVRTRAIAGGAIAGSEVVPREHALAGPEGGTLRMLQGSVRDPFGHIWLIGKFLD
jgi:PhnB protein